MGGAWSRLRATAACLIVTPLALAAPATAAAKPGAPLLRITLLGTGNPRPAPDRSGPATLVEAGATRILVDAGRGATTRLFQVGQGKLVAGIDVILLTHLHSDHVVGLPDVWLTGWIFGHDRPLELYGPPGTSSMMEALTKAYAFDVGMRRDVDEKLPAEGVTVNAHDVAPGAVLERGDLKITAFAVDHRPVAPAYGYRIDVAGRSVVFSGDTRYSESLITHARGCDVLVHEVLAPAVERRLSQMRDPAATEKVIAHHTTPEDAGRVFAAVAPRLAVYTHIVPSPTTAADLIPATRKAYKGRLAVGEDLMTITIGESVTIRKRSLRH